MSRADPGGERLREGFHTEDMRRRVLQGAKIKDAREIRSGEGLLKQIESLEKSKLKLRQ